MLQANLRLESLNFDDCDQRFVEKNKTWFKGFIDLRDRNKLKEVTLFSDNHEYYALIGFKENDSWSVIPLPIFHTIASEAGSKFDREVVNQMTKDLLNAYPEIVKDSRETYEDEQSAYVANNLEKYVPIEDEQGLKRLEAARRYLGCQVTVSDEDMEAIVALPWPKQVAAYDTAIKKADGEHELDEWETVGPNLPYLEDGVWFYTTGTGNTQLRVDKGVFTAIRLDSGSLARSHPVIYELAGGQTYPGYVPASKRDD